MNNVMKKLLSFFSLLLFVCNCGCDKQHQESGYKLERIHTDKTELVMLKGDTDVIKASPVPSTANTVQFAWATSDAKVATVDDGKIEAVGFGEATITVSLAGKTTSVPVMVTAVPPADAAFYNGASQLFHPASGFMNDPNGLFYKDGIWHMYFQYDPNINATNEGKCWGHAVSRDLYHWRECKVAIRPDENGAIWSGGCVIDERNVAGFGKDAVLAFYTSYDGNKVKNQQTSLYYSSDGGYTFTPAPGNPIMAPDDYDVGFRDPQIVWYDPMGIYVMTLTRGKAVDFYKSENLRDWTLLSRFEGTPDMARGTFECPSLFPISDGSQTKWVVMACSLIIDSMKGRSGVLYYLGDFVNGEFIPDDTETHMADFGATYAGSTWNHADRRIMTSWLFEYTHWQAHYQEPMYRTSEWCGRLTTPREITLGTYNGRQILKFYPPKEVLSAASTDDCVRGELSASQTSLKCDPFTLTFDPATATVTTKGLMNDAELNLDASSKHDVLILREDYCAQIFIDGGAVCHTGLLSQQ